MGAFNGIHRFLSPVPVTLQNTYETPLRSSLRARAVSTNGSALERAVLSKTSQYGSPGSTTSRLLPNLATTLHLTGTSRHK
jgi:hypothetical protein